MDLLVLWQSAMVNNRVMGIEGHKLSWGQCHEGINHVTPSKKPALGLRLERSMDVTGHPKRVT
jgi:hypothetical protein